MKTNYNSHQSRFLSKSILISIARLRLRSDRAAAAITPQPVEDAL